MNAAHYKAAHFSYTIDNVHFQTNHIKELTVADQSDSVEIAQSFDVG